MILPLAMEVDLMTLGGIIATVLTTLGAGLKLIWAAGVQIAYYFKPKLDAWFKKQHEVADEGIQLAREMKDHIPKVSKALEDLSSTQKEQCESLKALNAASDRHEERHNNTSKLLGELHQKVDKLSGEHSDPVP